MELGTEPCKKWEWFLASFGAMAAMGKKSKTTVHKQQPEPDTLPVLRASQTSTEDVTFNYSSEMPAVSLNPAPH